MQSAILIPVIALLTLVGVALLAMASRRATERHLKERGKRRLKRLGQKLSQHPHQG